MVDVTRTVIRLGNFSDGIPDIDVDGTQNAENADALLGFEFTSASMSVQDVVYSDSFQISFDGANGGDTVTYDTGAGSVSEFVDQAVWYEVDVLLENGTTVSKNALIFQTASGETFMTEFSFLSLDNLAVVSITPRWINNSSFGSMSTDTSVTGTTIVCFGRGTQIMTPDGPRAVETIRPRDLVSTTDGVSRPVVAVYHTRTDPQKKDAVVRIEPNALGQDMPSSPLYLTGNHRILCANRLVERMFDTQKVFLPAKRFADLNDVTPSSNQEDRSFFHLELSEHSVVWANGALVESCLLGEMTRRSLPGFLLRSIAQIEPEETRYPVPKGARQDQFVRRLMKNDIPVVDRALCAHDFAALNGDIRIGQGAAQNTAAPSRIALPA